MRGPALAGTVGCVTDPDEALFIGRVREPGSLREHVVRVRTDGRAPTPDDRVEEIACPFEGARPGLHAEGWGDPVELARGAEPIPGGVAGQLGGFELAPPVRPGKILGIGRNYRAHAEELGNEVPSTPLVFFKPPSALVPAGAPIEIPGGYERVDFEGELVVVMGRRARDVAAGDAWAHVAGLALGNDVSCRDLQKSDRQWTRAKGFDTFAPLGPFVRMWPRGEPWDEDLGLRAFVDDALRQQARVGQMVFPVGELVAHISACMTLEPGDLIYTGTPAGVGPLAPGNVVRVEATGLDLGRLVNPVLARG